MAIFWSGFAVGERRDRVRRLERVGDDQVVAVIDGGLQVVGHGGDVRRLDDLGLDAAFRARAR